MFHHAILTLFGFAGQMVVTLLAGILAARLLAPTGRGELAALLMVPLFLMQVANIGTPQALTYFAAREAKKAGKLMGSSYVLQAGATLVAIAIGWVGMPYLLSDYSVELIAQARWIMLLMLVLMPLYGTPMCVFLGRKDYVEYNLQRLLPSVIYLLAVVGAIWGFAAFDIALGYMLGMACVGLPYVAWTTYRKIGQKVWPDRKTLREMTPYALITFVGTLPQTTGQRLDQFVTLAVLSLTDLGHYAIAVGMGQMYLTLQLGVGTVLLPHLADKGEDVALRAVVFAKTLRLAMVLALGLVSVGVLLLPWVLPLMFGAAYTPAVVPAQLLLVAYGLLGLCGILGDGFRGCGLPRLPLWMELTNLVVKAGLFIMLYAQLNLNVVAGVTLAGAALSLLVAALGYHRYVTPLDRAWWAGFDGDVRWLVARLWGLVMRVIRR